MAMRKPVVGGAPRVGGQALAGAHAPGVVEVAAADAPPAVLVGRVAHPLPDVARELLGAAGGGAGRVGVDGDGRPGVRLGAGAAIRVERVAPRPRAPVVATSGGLPFGARRQPDAPSDRAEAQAQKATASSNARPVAGWPARCSAAGGSPEQAVIWAFVTGWRPMSTAAISTSRLARLAEPVAPRGDDDEVADLDAARALAPGRQPRPATSSRRPARNPSGGAAPAPGPARGPPRGRSCTERAAYRSRSTITPTRAESWS